MSVTIAMFFLIEATTACGPVAPARLGGGAEVVRAILDVEGEDPDLPVQTLTGLRRSAGSAAGDAELETYDVDSDPAPAQCEVEPMPIA